MSTTVKALLTEIKTNLTQTSSSTKDEELVMRALLNDREYKVDIYGKDGVTDKFCPAQEARDLIANVMHGAAKLSKEEAAQLADGYEFKKSDSLNMINISKEFVNTFIQTGRKLPLGGRKDMDVSLSLKEVPKSTRTYPKKVGVNSDGSPRFEKAEAKVPAHSSVRVHASCPSWIKK